MPDAETHGDFRILDHSGVTLGWGHCEAGDVESPIKGPPVPTVDHATLHAINTDDANTFSVVWDPPA